MRASTSFLNVYLHAKKNHNESCNLIGKNHFGIQLEGRQRGLVHRKNLHFGSFQDKRKRDGVFFVVMPAWTITLIQIKFY